MNSGIYGHFIGGDWVRSSVTMKNINPSDTRDVIGEFSQADAAMMQSAIVAASEGQKAWAASGLEERYRALMAIDAELMERSRELGHALSREEGKPLAEGVGEVYRSGQFFQYYAAEVLRNEGESIDSVRPGVEVDTRREPVGVVGVVTPWNFPMATAAWKIAPALAFGNAVVFKPANLVPYSAWALTDVIARQGLPAGTFNLVMGSGAEAGEALIQSDRIQALSFTGSLPVGRRVAAATAGNLVRCQLEMGSKNALVVMDDANLDLAVEAAMAGAYSGSGQKCTASSRLVVHEKVHDAFVARLMERMQSLKVGPATDEATRIGPVVDQKQLDSIQRYIELGEREGARRVMGGERIETETPGFYMSPCLFTDTRNQMQINRDEIFGPVASVIRVADFDEALAVVNDTDFGLTAGIVTDSLKLSHAFRNQVVSGCIMVNLPTAGTDYHVPFGGRKASSFGPREQGRYARDFYTTVKTTYVRAGG